MNCCNHNCNQGRNCPARGAKIGRKDYAKEPYPPSHTPRRIKAAAMYALTCIAAVFFAVFALVLGFFTV